MFAFIHASAAPRSFMPWLAAACLSFSAASAHAVVESGHWHVVHNSTTTQHGNLSISVDQTVGGDHTGSFLTYDAQAGTLKLNTVNLDEGSELFLVKPGDVLSAGTADALPSLFDTSTPLQVGKDFYLGAGTRSASDPGFSWAGSAWTSWGWAHLKVDGSGKLALVDSAMAFREGGILVGTLTAVPEPGTWAMMAFGLATLAGLRKTRRSNEG